MNRKMTPILLAAALALGLITYVSERPTATDGASATATAGTRVLDIDPADILQIRVRRDYWNSYTLKRTADGSWQLTEPSLEPASGESVNRLVDALGNLAVLNTIDLPSDDSERHREYGLWEPSMEVTVTTGAGERTLIFGTQTSDGQGTYCAESGHDRVWVTPAGTAKQVAVDASMFRISHAAAASQPSAELKIEDIALGTGEPLHAGQIATIHYRGTLADGTEFDSSAKHGKPMPVKVGAHQVIQGWDLGLVGMRTGGKRRLIVPPELAYGPKGRPPAIPPNATLTFELELVSIVNLPPMSSLKQNVPSSREG
jgi:hypothetical protein